jgi:hypothetical protein
MNNFTFHNYTRVLFGKGMESRTGREMKSIGTKALLHYGGGSIRENGLYDRLVASLQAADMPFVELGGVQPNPRVSLVREGIDLCRREGVDCILAAGGGSVIDSAKAIAIGIPYEGDVWDFFAAKAKARTATPVGVVLTMPAAGSETSTRMVISNEEGAHKTPLGYPFSRPQFAVLNPEIAFTLPAYQVACGAADIMAHIMERYFTTQHNVEVTDGMCEAVLRTVINTAPRVLAEPDNYDAWAELMWAGTIAHNDILDTGRTGDWSSHNIEHQISALYDVAHGAGLAVVFPAWMQHVYPQDVERFVQYATRVWGVPYLAGQQDRVARAGIERLKSFFSSIGLPVSLQQLGVGDDRIDDMARKACERGAFGSFKKLAADDVHEILQSAV